MENKTRRAFSGRITFRTAPREHAALAKATIVSGKRSINTFVDEAVARYKAALFENRT